MEEVLPRYYEGAVRVWEGLPEKRAEEIIGELETVARNAERIGKAEATPKSEDRNPKEDRNPRAESRKAEI